MANKTSAINIPRCSKTVDELIEALMPQMPDALRLHPAMRTSLRMFAQWLMLELRFTYLRASHKVLDELSATLQNPDYHEAKKKARRERKERRRLRKEFPGPALLDIRPKTGLIQ